MKPLKFWRSGLVRRWHQNPEMSQFYQTNGAHQWGVVTLLLILFPEATRDEIIAAHTHDVGEIDAGDLANPKKLKNPELTGMLDEFEKRSRKETIGQHLTCYFSEERLHLCDKLEAYLYMKTFNPRLADRDGWPEQLQRMKELATKLNCREKFEELITGV